MRKCNCSQLFLTISLQYIWRILSADGPSPGRFVWFGWVEGSRRQPSQTRHDVRAAQRRAAPGVLKEDLQSCRHE